MTENWNTALPVTGIGDSRLLGNYRWRWPTRTLELNTFVDYNPEDKHTFWGKPDLLPSGDRRSCFHSHMGLWLMEPGELKQRASMVIAGLATENSLDYELQPEMHSEGFNFDSGLPAEKYTAVVPVTGAITKKRSKFAETSALETRRMVRQLANDPSVEKIVLHIDSPGGAVSGISDLAAEIKSARESKPVVAFIEDMGASAAYWIASQCDEIVANSGAFVGSLGTYGVIHDTSGAYERQGVKVHLISSGGIKGKGADGTPIDEEVLADQQRVVDTINALFKADVAAGRNFGQKKIDSLFDGRVHGAEEALAMGLIDRIGTLDSVLKAEDMPKKDKEEKEQPEEEEEEEEMPEKESSLKEDIKALAEQVKAAGCPFSVTSIESKLAKEAAKHEDEMDALEAAMALGTRLSCMKPIVGDFAAQEVEPKITPEPKTYADAVKAYKAVADEWKSKPGNDPMKVVSYMRDNHPELAKALIEKAGTSLPAFDGTIVNK